MVQERTPFGQFTGVARISGVELVLLPAVGSVFAVVVVFTAIWLVG